MVNDILWLTILWINVDINQEVGYSMDSILFKGVCMVSEIVFGLVLVAFILGCVLWLYIKNENKQFRMTHYHIKNPSIPKGFEGTKIVFLSDLHGYQYGDGNERLIKAIEGENPDYIFIGGDMFVKGIHFDGKVALSLIEKLGKRYPIYYSNGNHELRVSKLEETKNSTYVEYVESLKKCKVHYLVDKTVEIKKNNESIRVVGLNLSELYYSKFKKQELPVSQINKCIGKKQDGKFTILLAHNPMYFKEYSNWGAELVLSGHVHGGMIALPYIGGIVSTQGWLFPKYDFGEFKEGTSTMLLSRGLGNHTINVRINNRAEVVVIHLQHS